jgi:hypothetical protein
MNRTGRLTAGHANAFGYLVVNVGKRQHLLHRLVARVHLPPPKPGQTQVDHINGDKGDARAANLRWCSGSENCKFAHANGLHDATRRAQRARREQRVHDLLEWIREHGGAWPRAVRNATDDLERRELGLAKFVQKLRTRHPDVYAKLEVDARAKPDGQPELRL